MMLSYNQLRTLFAAAGAAISVASGIGSGAVVAQERLQNASSWATSVQPARQTHPATRDARPHSRTRQDVSADTAPLLQTRIIADPVPPKEVAVQPAVAAPPEAPANQSPAPAERAAADAAVAEYCRNIAPAAGEARALFIQQNIALLERQLERKTAELDARMAEFKEWVARRQQLADQASASLVQLFSRMRPEAAAQQVAMMDENVAAALLMKLDAKIASALLSEIPPSRAARLATVMTEPAPPKPPSRETQAETADRRQQERSRK